MSLYWGCRQKPHGPAISNHPQGFCLPPPVHSIFLSICEAILSTWMLGVIIFAIVTCAWGLFTSQSDRRRLKTKHRQGKSQAQSFQPFMRLLFAVSVWLNNFIQKQTGIQVRSAWFSTWRIPFPQKPCCVKRCINLCVQWVFNTLISVTTCNIFCFKQIYIETMITWFSFLVLF